MQDIPRENPNMGDAQNDRNDRLDTVSFTERMLASEAFTALFRDGMALVEATASYLDGAGRDQSRDLDRGAALAYASESMRLTTRLMQLTSWLLLQRAVNEGELTREDADREHRRVVIATQENSVSPELLAQLPEALRDLIDRSLRLQERIRKLDSDRRGSDPVEVPASNPIADQLSRLNAAFGGRN